MVLYLNYRQAQRILLPIVLLLSITFASAQHGDLGTWNVVNLKYRINHTWSFFGEAQARSFKFYDNFYYTEFKGATNFNFNKNISVSLGLGSYQTFADAGNFARPRKNSEFRVWPMFTLLNNISKLKIEHRVRAEMRFFETEYRKRFRYRLNVIYPFGKLKNDYQPYAIAVSDEVFFSDKKPVYARNRFLANFNYKPSRSTTLQCGYLHQIDYGLKKDIGRDFLQLGFLLDISKFLE